jgi:creatinine amidohydrolase
MSELERMTWQEAEEAIKSADYIIVPIGSHEQHSYHLELQNDIALTYEIAKKIAEKAKLSLRILVSPRVSYGLSEHHMHFPGTITLSPETFMGLIGDICSSLVRHGAKNIVLLNGHGGNDQALWVAATELQRELERDILIIDWWRFARDIEVKEAKSEFWGHACEMETSMAMYLLPDTVRRDRIVRPFVRSPEISLEPKGYSEKVQPNPTRYFEDYTNTGSVGDPTYASKELGEKLIEASVDRILYILTKFLEKTK